MAVGAKRRWWLVAGGVLGILLVGGGVVWSNPPAPPVGMVLAADSASFGTEAVLAWSESELVASIEPNAMGSTAAGLVKAGNQSIYGWNNGVTNAFSGDFNGDGKWDVGVTGTASDGERCWYIRYGDGKGGFGNQTQYCWGNGVTNVFTGDFNGDGKWDIGVTGTAADKERNWYIRYGDGKGSFGNQTTYWWGNGVTRVFTGDFNADGKWDIGVTGTAAEKERNWYIRYGDGKGGFGNETRYAWGNGVTNAFTGDFNGDGKWDIGVTGTSADKERTWYIRYGDGKGGFTGEDTYNWGNGVTNLFTGDFNGDKMWDLGVTGDKVLKDGNWYIRYNQMPKASVGGNNPAPNPAGDAVAKLAADLADSAYANLLGRSPSQSERETFVSRMKAGATADDLWRDVARSQERLDRYGHWAPATGAVGGKIEQCFGAVGSKCDGAPFTPAPEWTRKFTRPDGVEMGYVKIAVAVGSILHDNICLDTPMGSWCSGPISIPAGELPVIKTFVPASMEWNKAVYNVRDGRYWMYFFGPYPTNGDKRAQWSDDLTRVTARSSKLALVGPLVASPIVTEPYQGKESRQTKILKAPAGTYLDESDTAFCASGKAAKEGRWWTAQWWIKCN